MDVIAVLFDFDDTLTPDSTGAFLRSRDVDSTEFYKRATDLAAEGYDNALAYLNLLLDGVRDDPRLQGLTNADLVAFGSSLDNQFFPGLPELFDDLRSIVANSGIADMFIEFYVISSGLESVLMGSEVVREHFDGVYACQFAEHPETGIVHHIKRCVTFTEKTRYVFEINKGLQPEETKKNPHLVNKFVAQEDRRVPLRNMIYVGDGLTDIPCFSLIEREGGTAFGVFDAKSQEKARRAFQEFAQPHRVTGVYRPRYGDDDDLGSLIRATVQARLLDLEVARKTTRRV
jgi:phosphoserine phosphatase